MIGGWRRKPALVASALGLLTACSNDPEPSPRRVFTYTLPHCPLPKTGAELELLALGDYEPSNRSSEIVGSSSSGRSLLFTDDLRALAVRTTDVAPAFLGYAERAGERVDVVLWPGGAACALTLRDGELAYPGERGGQALGYDPLRGTLLLVGGNDAQSGEALVGSLQFSTRTGALTRDANVGHVLPEPRAFASVTPFAGKLLVAGGEDPVHDVDEPSRIKFGSALVFDPNRGGFESAALPLVEARSRHGALLSTSGETLLVGGRGPFGDALTAVEAISPDERRSRISGLTQLLVGRAEPQVLRLRDGRILVAGGVTSAGAPAAGLEWLAADASEHEATALARVIPPRFGRAFLAMPGGGVLAVGGCEARAPSDADESQVCALACARGCPPKSGYDAFWVGRDGAVRELDLSGISAPRPFLAAGSDGAPWLFADEGEDAESEPGRDATLYRFDPFRGRFERTLTLLAAPVRDGPPPMAIDPGLVVWVGAEPQGVPALYGLRSSTRGPYVNDVALIVAARDDDSGAPAHLVPDFALAGEVEYDGALRFLGAGPRFWLADADFADVGVELEAEGEAQVWLGERAYGWRSCPWPSGSGRTLGLERRGARVTLTREAAPGARPPPSRDCAGPPGRVAIGLGGEAGSVLGALRVRRLTL